MRLLFPPARLHETEKDAILGAERIVLFGAGIYAEPVVYALGRFGVHPALICDNAIAKQGKQILGISVVSPEQAQFSIPGTVVVITSAVPYIEEIRKQALELGGLAIFSCISLLNDWEYSLDTFSSGLTTFHIDTNRYLADFFHRYHPGTLVIESMDIMITEKCTLKCRDCSNLMQYYQHPKDLDFQELFSTLDQVMASVDHVMEFRVLGGETFLNRAAHEYIQRLLAYPNATRVIVYSNGTLLPPQDGLDCLKHEQVLVRITDYGRYSRKVPELTALLDREKIQHTVEPCLLWQDCATMRPVCEDGKQLIEQFSRCQARNYLTLLKRKIYICPFSANAHNLNGIPEEKDSFVEIVTDIHPEDLRTSLGSLLRERDYTGACKYCVGRHMEPTIPSAVQTTNPLSYSRWL